MKRDYIEYGRCYTSNDCNPSGGLRPRFIVAQERMTEIMEAIARYSERQKVIPMDWIYEYNELADYMKKNLK